MDRRKGILLVSILLFAVAGVVAVLFLRPKNPCIVALGPLPELERATGRTLAQSKAIGPYDGVCSADVYEPGQLSTRIASVDREKISFELEKQKWARSPFAASGALAIGDEGMFFEAGKDRAPTMQELSDRLKTGALVASLPAEEHVAISRFGEYVFVLKFNRDAFTPDTAKAEAAAIMGRAHTGR